MMLYRPICNVIILFTTLSYGRLQQSELLVDLFEFEHQYFGNHHQKDIPVLPKGWTSCGKSDDVFQLESFTITPEPPKRGTFVTINVKGNLLHELDGGKLNYTVKFGIIPIVKDSMELCEALKMEPGIPQCPLRKGKWDVTHDVEVPMETPFGRYSITASAWDKEGKEIFCLQGETTLGLFSKIGNIETLDGENPWDRQAEFP